MSKRAALWILSAFLLLQAGVHWLSMTPGPLLVDEVAYHFMTRAVAEGHPWEVENGYREHPAPSLEIPLTRTVVAYEGRLVSKYPYLLPWLAGMLYPHLGFTSLIAVNLLAHTVALALTYWIARHYLRSFGWALLAPVYLALATYFWEYAEGAWPHSLGMAFSTGAFACALMSLERGTEPEQRRGALGWALASGALVGVGAGARLDVALWLFIVGVLFLSPPRPRLLLALGTGANAGFLLLAFDNYAKFEVPWPFTYRSDGSALVATYGRYVPIVVLAIAIGAATLAWHGSRTGPALRRWLSNASPMHYAALALPVIAALALGRHHVVRFLGGVFDIAVDFSAFDPARSEPAMARTASGAVVYFGHYKKALLQSCPYLAALILPVLLRARSRFGAPPLWPLYLPLLILLSVFATRSWHGGMCLNMRYLLPALPMTSVLIVWVVREIHPTTKAGWTAGALALPATAGAYLLTPLTPGSVLEFKVLAVPVLIAGCLLVACLSSTLARGGGLGRWLLRSRFALLVAASSWAALISLGYDYPAQRGLRAYNERTAQAVRSRIEPDALLFVAFIDPFSLLIDAERVRLANPFQDDLASLAPLAEFHLAAGRAVYGAFSLPAWKHVRGHALRAGLSVGHPEVLPTGFVLASFLPRGAETAKAHAR